MRDKFLSLIPWLLALLLIVLAIWPRLDLSASALFYRPGSGFYLASKPLFVLLHRFGTQGAWVLGALLIAAVVIACLWRGSLFGLDTKGWIFLLLGLLIGPGLIANMMLKDHWGRARPHQVTEFGGSERFTPYYAPQPHAQKNGSFVAGDPSFGFYLPSFGYVFSTRRYPKLIFWGGMAVGGLLGFARLAMGGHFLSDIICSAFLMLGVTAALYGLMYGPGALRDCWRQRMGLHS